MVDKAIDRLVKAFPEDKFILKLLEECAEVSEVLLKYLTKRETLKPAKEKIIEELGDVVFRAKALARKMDIEKEVQQRVEQKAKIMYEWVGETLEN